jgi:hypothetical protein
MKAANLYDRDFAEWAARNAALLRQRRFDEADVEHVAEEIQDMGKRDRREVSNRLKVLIVQLLKWAAQPARRDGSTWSATIDERRSENLRTISQPAALCGPGHGSDPRQGREVGCQGNRPGAIRLYSRMSLHARSTT